MERRKVTIKTETEKELEEFMKQNADKLYKKTSQVVGDRVKEGNKDKKFTSDGKFTKVLT